MKGLVGEIKRFLRTYRGLSAGTLLGLLRVSGVPTANTTTFDRWQNRTVAPSAASEQMWRRGLFQVQQTLDAALNGRGGSPTPLTTRAVKQIRGSGGKTRPKGSH
jgi:hypothetical protein